MARQLSESQVAELKEAVSSVPDIQQLGDLTALVSALRSSPQTAFSEEDLASIEAGFDVLNRQPDARTEWQTAKGRGLFVVFEGLDRSGKSTQSRKLREHLQAVQGKDMVKWMCFPNRDTALGCLIDLYLRRQIELPDGAIHLLFSANRWEMADAIVDDLNRGISVVCDRYAFSGVAYSAAKGLDFAWCQSPDRGLPLPDLVFFMRVDPQVGASRANFGDERYEDAGMQARVRDEFSNPRLHHGVPWHVVDGGREIEEIHMEIRGTASVASSAEQPAASAPVLRRLWTQ
uniref:Thymidylate kinase n=1 Tax=Zooxanthella nutricula TaxID=1333877 RepID=A0A6V0IF02_9DINO|mmetsp:Transcript_67610/g.207090  ORF Transcript_67610/g.207090 Transcript_67610/m.207090 type:complete len:289 (+) Transcript_67610:79-945(+)|eukprot:CAMPEP_0198525376 /NCGR_PEP_ID=MMETSP1462-20131121/23323_1 /TAXON_ID=1333877 /ORGANISM="Brandtodinium nutriculum, Strain RCC3387" /LENGTH=288 /DNA_ID=CAMNT_0044255131 /DNA_START=79 /DNA_END=945 /DNA_ORIENTATION=-